MGDLFVGIDGTTPNPDQNVRFDKWDFGYSFIYMMYKYCSAGQGDKIHIAGPNLYGQGTSQAIEEALSFIAKKLNAPGSNVTRIAIAGYSRGAYAALRVAQALHMINRNVDFLGLIDVVKCTDDMTEHAISRLLQDFSHEDRTVSGYLSKLPPAGRTMSYMGYSAASGAASYQNIREISISEEVNRSIMPNAFSAGTGAFVVPKGVMKGFHARRSPSVGSRTIPMGHYPLVEMPSNFAERRDFKCTHSAMGGMPFRGDILKNVTRRSEWLGTRDVGQFIIDKSGDFLGKVIHPVLNFPTPPPSWYQNKNIREQYTAYMDKFGIPDGDPWDKPFEDDYFEQKKLDRQAANARGRY